MRKYKKSINMKKDNEDTERDADCKGVETRNDVDALLQYCRLSPFLHYFSARDARRPGSKDLYCTYLLGLEPSQLSDRRSPVTKIPGNHMTGCCPACGRVPQTHVSGHAHLDVVGWNMKYFITMLLRCYYDFTIILLRFY